ncbi:FecR family protein [Luteolibacter arcticus]|uniref:FecR family protein n=1 Tax=Luteolibacter arcticus TaxID=1581411 RepID=A0ABT3GFM7_9BACT|nr:FecR family protein [Luteolibacter arcticus]MCW1922266.1 FecR family protein [Luteolibacter arcticus]
MIPPAPNAELRKLIDRMLDEEPLSRTELARLEELLDDEAGLQYYLSVVQQDAVMGTVLADLGMDDEVPPANVRPIRSRLRSYWHPAAAAALFVAGFFASEWWNHGSSGDGTRTTGNVVIPGQTPARVTGMMGVRWKNGAPPDLIGKSGSAGGLAIESGLVEITYGTGVRVTLEGPAEFDVTGTESGRLAGGKLVTSVPKGAEGFRIDYQDGTVVDLGTEFAMDVKPGRTSEVGVFNGKIELHREGEKPLPLYENHAVFQEKANTESPLQSIPLDRTKYVRQLPSREFAWELDSFEPKSVEFDVSHLLWKPSAYRAVFKWMNGADGIQVRDVELRLDGQRVAGRSQTGSSGALVELVKGNIFKLDVANDQFRSGRWTIHATVEPLPRSAELAATYAPVRSLGILQFEEGLATTATPADFTGQWSYRFLGDDFIREIHPDGTITLFKNGSVLTTSFVGSRWTVVDGVLRVTVPDQNAVEDHVLRDHDTLIFINRHYENAIRVAPGLSPDSR